MVLKTQELLQAWTLTHHETQHQPSIWILTVEDCIGIKEGLFPWAAAYMTMAETRGELSSLFDIC